MLTTKERIERLERVIYESIEYGGSLIGSMDEIIYPNAMKIWKEKEKEISKTKLNK